MWFAVDEDGDGFLFVTEPSRVSEDTWFIPDNHHGYIGSVPPGQWPKPDMTWADEPIEVTLTEVKQ